MSLPSKIICYIKFNKLINSIIKFITEYVKSQRFEMIKHSYEVQWWSSYIYIRRIKETPGMMELVSALFILKMLVSILPSFSSSSLSVVELYETFVAQAFERQYSKQLTKSTLLKQQRSQTDVVCTVDEYRAHALKVASQMMLQDRTFVEVLFSDSDE